ncbi:dynein regulatory complex subunit 7 [Bacillus rossius redtenbacheri]|uniref:dynein regulatory complex subunit 7 n=1 Tax=Bacillus rossius redtenbacheri TaxID=93214 RepID=UPI002FDDF23A
MVQEVEEDVSKREQWPASYCAHTDRELLLLSCAEDLRRRHHEQRPARRPLLLVPRNECGEPKMVCTAVCPTGFHQPELFLSWQGAATFVADHVQYLPLEDPVSLPQELCSPATVLHTQRGNCFELSVLLASMLTGAWYDAYVVSGYACRELCLGDHTSEDYAPWPEELPPQVSEGEPTAAEAPKYHVQLEQQFESQYLLERKRKELRRLEEIEEKKREEEMKALEALERPPLDELSGVRVHSWVLVRAGRHGVERSFFLEPASGRASPVRDPCYLGVESAWSHENYWVHLRGPALPEEEDYDLDDSQLWEALRPGPGLGAAVATSTPRFLLLSRQLDMPPSWSEPLLLSRAAYELRFPEGSKTQLYKKARLQRWAPLLRPDGLVAELTRYVDYDRQEPCQVVRRYRQREDRLEHSKTHVSSGAITETFRRGRPDFLVGHSHTEGRDQLQHERVMSFNHAVHLDNLCEVRLGAQEMCERFESREDRLYERCVTFAPAVEGQPSAVLSVTEKFYRNSEKPAWEDVASRLFALTNNTISLTYHVAEDNFTANWRTFKKPPGYLFGERFRFEPSMTQGYQADPTAPAPRMLHLFRLFEQQLQAEDRALFLVRSRQAEVVKILQQRESEIATHKLKISPFDVERNEEARQAVKLQEQQLAERLHQVQAEAQYEQLFLPEPESETQDPLKVRGVCLV